MEKLESLSELQKQEILDQANQEQDLPEESNTENVTAKELGIFEQASKDGDIRGQIAKMTAINLTALNRFDQLAGSKSLSMRNLVKAIIAAARVPDGTGNIKFGGTEAAQAVAQEVFYHLQAAITTRGVALERNIKYELEQKAKEKKELEEAQNDSTSQDNL